MKAADRTHPLAHDASRQSLCLATLTAQRDHLCLRWLASDVSHGEAKERVRRVDVGPNAVFVAACEFSTVVSIQLPRSRLDTVEPSAIRMAQRHLGAWVEWLRETAVLQFGLLSRDLPEQHVPAKYLHDRRVRALFGLSGAPAVASSFARLSLLDVRDFATAAHPFSVLGLARSSLDATTLGYWLSDVDPQDLPSLCIPLLSVTAPIEAQAAGLRLGVSFLQQASKQSPFSLGTLTHLTIDLAGRIGHQDYPADLLGIDWAPPSANLATRLPDQVYRSVGDLPLGSMFCDLPRTLDTILGRARTPMTMLGQRLHDQLSSECDRVKTLISQNVFPFDSCASTARISHFLFADGDPDRQSRRRDALDSFPLAVSELSSDRMPTVASAIDDGLSLFRAIGKECDAPPWAVRRARDALAGVPRFEDTTAINLSVIIRLLARLGPDVPCPDAGTLRMLVDELKAYPLLSPLSEEATWQFQLLARSIGRDARLRGWEHTLGTVRSFKDTDDLQVNMAYWDVVRHNVADVLASRRMVLKSRDEVITAVMVDWLGQLTLPQMAAHCLRWSGLRWGDHRRQGAIRGRLEASMSVEMPFAEHSLVQSRVAVSPLLSKDSLEAEGEDMDHCVASYWRGVMTFQILVVALRSETGRRATLSVQMQTDGKWNISELYGPKNTAVRSNSTLAKGADEFVASLNFGHTYSDPAEVRKYREAALTRTRIVEHLQGDRPSLIGLPDDLRTMVEPCFPGMGPIEERILRAHSRIAQPR